MSDWTDDAPEPFDVLVEDADGYITNWHGSAESFGSEDMPHE